MLSTLRCIRFPEHLQVSGAIIKAELIGCVRDHYELIDQAKHQAQEIVKSAHVEAITIKETVKAEVAARLQNDLNTLRQFVTAQDKKIRDTASQLCVDICNAVVRQVLSSAPADQKIMLLVNSLLETSRNARELKLMANPAQCDIVETQIGKIMATELNTNKWSVFADPEIPEYELRITTNNSAEIRVSLENLIALYENEIRAAGHELQPILSSRNYSDETLF